MPELPEVEHSRRVAEAAGQDRLIREVFCDADDVVLDGCSSADVVAALLGSRIRAVQRRGKHLWLELDRRPHLLIHLGMTGAIRTPGDEPLSLETGTADGGTWPPRHLKLLLTFEDGTELAFTNARRFGRLALRQDPLTESPIADLGFDPLLDMPALPEFAARLRRRRGTLKGVLLDQRFAAGSGNWIADEVLYQAGLDPRRKVPSLQPGEVAALRDALEHVVRTAVAVDARKAALPGDWLFHRRWGRQEGITTADGHAVEHLTVAGRTTAWVPSVQS